MASRRIDWFAIPRRYRAWQAKPTWRKVLWLVSRSVSMLVLYVLFAGAILWYNQPEIVGGVVNGTEPVWSILTVFGTQPELLVIMAILVPAVVASVLLPHRTVWT